MTVKLSSLRVDSTRVNDGDWVEATDIGEGVAFKVRSAYYKPYDIARQQATARLRRQMKGKPAADEDILLAVGPALAEHILLDWRGFDVPYSREVAAAMFADIDWRHVISRVQTAAFEVGEADVQTVEAAAKN